MVTNYNTVVSKCSMEFGVGGGGVFEGEIHTRGFFFGVYFRLDVNEAKRSLYLLVMLFLYGHDVNKSR